MAQINDLLTELIQTQDSIDLQQGSVDYSENFISKLKATGQPAPPSIEIKISETKEEIIKAEIRFFTVLNMVKQLKSKS